MLVVNWVFKSWIIAFDEVVLIYISASWWSLVRWVVRVTDHNIFTWSELLSSHTQSNAATDTNDSHDSWTSWDCATVAVSAQFSFYSYLWIILCICYPPNGITIKRHLVLTQKHCNPPSQHVQPVQFLRCILLSFFSRSI